MKTLTKTMIALGVLSATVMGTAGPTFARDARGHAFGNQAYGAHAQVPASRMGRLPLIREPTTHRDSMSSWDPYGLRWDGSE
jgi:hypothetical protein